MRTEHLGTDAWELDAEEVLALRRKLSEGRRTLTQYTQGGIYRGVLTGLTDVFCFWAEFIKPKIVWPEISKLPRFSMDTHGLYLGNTAFTIPGEDYYLLGLLNSWATWFFISKTAQPLRLRGDRWQYRLFAQYMEQVPVPDASEAERQPIADLARRCGEHAAARYELQTKVQRRLVQAFGQDTSGAPRGPLNQKAQEWWSLSLNELGQALKTSFKLSASPYKNPRAADEWEPYLAEHRREVDRLTRALADAEGELNDRVYHLFALTPEEIQLLQREVAH